MQAEIIFKFGLVLLVGILLLTFYNVFHVEVGFPKYNGSLGQFEESREIRRKQWEEALNLTLTKESQRRHRLPDVIGIGVQKCGTGALKSFLQLHPYIRALKSEGKFFDKYGWTENDLEDFRKMLPDAADHEIIMEKTPSYFWANPDNLPTLMHEIMPNLKIIVILCNPVQRTLSCFAMQQKIHGMKTQNFNSYVAHFLNSKKSGNREIFSLKKNERKDERCISHGSYKNHISRWVKEFNDSLFIINGEEFIANPGSVIERLQDFLQIPKLLREEDFVQNETTGLFCVNQWWKNLEQKQSPRNIYCLSSKKGRTRSKGVSDEFTMSNKTRTVLTKYFESFNRILYEIIGKKFNW